MPHPELIKVVGLKQISDTAKATLIQLAQEQDGVIPADAAHLMASATHRPIGDCSNALIELLAENLAFKNTEGRVEANFDLLGLAQMKCEIQSKLPAFEEVGRPHSPKGVSTLHELFDNEVDPIYLCTEVTHPSVFTRLAHRAELNRRTIFIVQGREQLRDDRKPHFDEVIFEWKKLVSGSPKIKRSIEIRIANEPNEALYTSALGRAYARFDMYRYDMESTRQGVLVRADRGSSFYEVISVRYQEVYVRSTPVASIWPGRWIRFQTSKYWIPTAAFASVFGIIHLLHWSAPMAIGSFAISFVARSAHEWWGKYRTRSTSLF
jgi:hypothetical protein